MISIEDCIAMCGLDSDQVAAIMEHEHVVEIEAAAIASDLLHREDGPDVIRHMLVDDVRAAQQSGDHRPRGGASRRAAPLPAGAPTRTSKRLTAWPAWLIGR